ncbi:hypothetical protein ACJX0J_039495, partial [Zea mays]
APRMCCRTWRRISSAPPCASSKKPKASAHRRATLCLRRWRGTLGTSSARLSRGTGPRCSSSAAMATEPLK